MTVVEKDGHLIISIPMNDKANLPASASGKTLIVASTGGNKETDLVVNGKKVTIGLNAYIYAKDK